VARLVGDPSLHLRLDDGRIVYAVDDPARLGGGPPDSVMSRTGPTGHGARRAWPPTISAEGRAPPSIDGFVCWR
jgi:hypothetical protein